MESKNPIKITRLDMIHHTLSVDSLPVDSTIPEYLSRFPPSMWPHVISLALSAGLQLLEKLEPDHINQLQKYQQFEHIRQILDTPSPAAISEDDIHLMQTLFRQKLNALWDSWQQDMNSLLENHLKSWTHHRNPEHSHRHS
ncbi:MAG: hypothetical protein C7B47_11330 [Sulfobacillus thermosulfidooxidans]|uniref:Uncharacterized protein n=1 Tax=Sulfobacillus thermosulfidooxidans TaxID=28034 RepID=A0A2T2WU90_SULTH|nr:MAG: hypothetical protein C7B47_11330 [Sulfobacillus thermosulfidooxidans]